MGQPAAKQTSGTQMLIAHRHASRQPSIPGDCTVSAAWFRPPKLASCAENRVPEALDTVVSRLASGLAYSDPAALVIASQIPISRAPHVSRRKSGVGVRWRITSPGEPSCTCRISGAVSRFNLKSKTGVDRAGAASSVCRTASVREDSRPGGGVGSETERQRGAASRGDPRPAATETRDTHSPLNCVAVGQFSQRAPGPRRDPPSDQSTRQETLFHRAGGSLADSSVHSRLSY